MSERQTSGKKKSEQQTSVEKTIEQQTSVFGIGCGR